MKITINWRRYHYVARVSVFLIMVALIAGMGGCTGGGAVEYDLTMAVAPGGSGTATDVTGLSPYAAGTGVSIKAVAAAGYDFVSWTAPAGGFANANAAETTFTMPAQDVTVTANFVTGYSVTMAVNPVGGGTATDLTNASPYAAGAPVQIEAVAAAGYRFVNWSAPAGAFDSATSATTTFTMPAQAVTVTANFEPEQVVVYDFIAEASSNTTYWVSGSGEVGASDPDWDLTFPGAMDDSKGFACYRTNVVLEDNHTYDRVLETHPQWVDDGYIGGGYLGLYDMGYKIETGERFYAKVGFLEGAAAGNVTFQVWTATDAGNVVIAEITDVYDGTLKTIDVDLSPYVTGLDCLFALVVLANGPSDQDCAAWVEARITSAGEAISSGTITIPGTYTFDFDAGVVSGGAADGDVFWRQVTSTTREMAPWSGATIANLGIVDFNAITPADLMGRTYGTTPINGSDVGNVLVPGDVFVVHTNAGNYAKARVVTWGYDITIEWVTYSGAT